MIKYNSDVVIIKEQHLKLKFKNFKISLESSTWLLIKKKKNYPYF